MIKLGKNLAVMVIGSVNLINGNQSIILLLRSLMDKTPFFVFDKPEIVTNHHEKRI